MEQEKFVDSLVEEVDAYIDHKISWAISGTKIEELEHDYFCEAISDIKYKLITKLKEKL
jgi:hypothetical protein